MKQTKSRRLVTGLLLAAFLPAAAAADSAPEVLVTSGESITVTTADFDAAARSLSEDMRRDLRTNPALATRLLEDVLVARVLAGEARGMGLDGSADAQAEMRQMVERVLAVRRMRALEESLNIPDFTAAAREQYEINKAKYMEPEEVRVAHILIDTRKRSEEEALKRAQEVHVKAVAGEDFAALAQEYSDDPSKKNGGDLGFFGRKRMVKPFEDAAFALTKASELSEPVKSPFGYHIIKFIERKPERQKSFEEVKDSLVTPMRNKLVSEEKARHVSKIRNDKSIKLNTEAIDRLVGKSPAAANSAAAPAKTEPTNEKR